MILARLRRRRLRAHLVLRTVCAWRQRAALSSQILLPVTQVKPSARSWKQYIADVASRPATLPLVSSVVGRVLEIGRIYLTRPTGSGRLTRAGTTAKVPRNDGRTGSGPCCGDWPSGVAGALDRGAVAQDSMQQTPCRRSLSKAKRVVQMCKTHRNLKAGSSRRWRGRMRPGSPSRSQGYSLESRGGASRCRAIPSSAVDIGLLLRSDLHPTRGM